MAKKTSKNRSK